MGRPSAAGKNNITEQNKMLINHERSYNGYKVFDITAAATQSVAAVENPAAVFH